MPAPAGAGSSPAPAESSMPPAGTGSSPSGVEPSLPPPGAGSPPPSTASEPAWSPASGNAGGPDGGATSVFEERPELAAGAAFAGGFVFAMILKRLAS